MDRYKGEHIGIWPFRRSWYHICSRHQATDKSCDLCMAGSYYSDVGNFFGAIIFRLSPETWIRLANRRRKRTLSKKDSGVLVEMLNNPQGPNEALRKAAERYKENFCKEKK